MMRGQGSCLTNVSDQIFQLFEPDKTAAGLVQGSECHLDSVEIMDNLECSLLLMFLTQFNLTSILPLIIRQNSSNSMEPLLSESN